MRQRSGESIISFKNSTLEFSRELVSGRMATKVKRKRLQMIVERSVLKKTVKGKMVKVTPNQPETLGLVHDVYRSGLAFLMPEGGTNE